mmetsp:Transcript_7049/g.11197  ORF Transcript_7049/g.11197 Transcript_7049/m.11197 type:complete len:225 (+) Transcript_7049:451-1125(+)
MSEQSGEGVQDYVDEDVDEDTESDGGTHGEDTQGSSTGFGRGERRSRYSYEEEEEELSPREKMLKRQFGIWGNSMVMFSAVGIGLYVTSKVFAVDFERFLGMVFLGGLGLLAARPGYNPGYSGFIDHGLCDAEVDTIRTFAKRRVELHKAQGEDRDEYLGKLKRSSYSAVHLDKQYEDPYRMRQSSSSRDFVYGDNATYADIKDPDDSEEEDEGLRPSDDSMFF